MWLFDRDLLAIYLQDHLAGATFGVALARRARAENDRGEYGRFLATLAEELDEDRETLAALMTELGVGSDRLKTAVGWAAEKAGRMKRNGTVLSYSPVSRVVELEGLISGVNGKLALWRTLRDLAGRDRRLDGAQLDGLIGRAEHQLAGLYEHHRSAAAAAFSGER